MKDYIVEFIYSIIDYEKGVINTVIKVGEEIESYKVPIASWAIRKYHYER